MTVKKCSECGLPTFGGNHKMSCSVGRTCTQGRDGNCGYCGEAPNNTCEFLDDVEDEQDFLSGVTCNPNAPEECESCQ
jgi:hypothetical protein